MLFNSLNFICFFIFLLVLYYLITPKKHQTWLLLAASYFFYATYNMGYLVLMIVFTILSYFFAIILAKEKSNSLKKIYLTLFLIVSIGNLIYYKYLSFINEIFYSVFNFFKLPYAHKNLEVIIPVGISFFTFEIIGYILDVFYEIREPEKKLSKYALFIAYFPKLLAGPIERSTKLLPQLHDSITFDYKNISWGFKLVLWGLFKKLVIADRLSVLVDPVYLNIQFYDLTSIITSTVLFTFQMYCDFSGYTDMAMGLSKMLGFKLLDNFNHPYVSKNISEFWRRWHISLSNWLRDYLYTPLMYSKKEWGHGALIWASFITFILCGLWHGPKWTFVIFGLLQGIAISYEILTKNQRKFLEKKVPSKIYNSLSWLITFCFIVFSFIFFRSNDLNDSILIMKKLVLLDIRPTILLSFVSKIGGGKFLFSIILLAIFILIDKHISYFTKKEVNHRGKLDLLLYSTLMVFIVLFGHYGNDEFIYFHF